MGAAVLFRRSVFRRNVRSDALARSDSLKTRNKASITTVPVVIRRLKRTQLLYRVVLVRQYAPLS
jgi:hypothetical protein